MAKCYFFLYNKNKKQANALLFIPPKRLEIEKVEILQISPVKVKGGMACGMACGMAY